MRRSPPARIALLAALVAACCLAAAGQKPRGRQPPRVEADERSSRGQIGGRSARGRVDEEPRRGRVGGESSRGEVNEAGVSFVYRAADFGRAIFAGQPRLTADEAGTDIPVAVFPKSRCFVLEGAGAAGEFQASLWAADNFICFFPLRDESAGDFGRAYPHLSSSAARLRRLLGARPARIARLDRFGFWRGAPEMPLPTAGLSLLARARYLDFRAASGILFLAQYSQETPASPANSEDLACYFQGITKDGRHYVAARFGLDHPSLIKDALSLDHSKLDKRMAYLRRDERKLARLPEDSFRPSLKNLKALLSSIEIR